MTEKNKFILTQEYLKKILKYDPETGIFVWLISPAWRVKVGDIAGNINSSHGYTQITINYKYHRAHRLAWFYMLGRWPKGDIDHTDQDKSNNSWDNLRESTNSANGANRPKQRNNTSGFKGVFWSKSSKKWRAQIRYNGKSIHIGTFACPVEAARAYNGKAIELFGTYAHLNIIEESS